MAIRLPGRIGVHGGGPFRLKFRLTLDGEKSA